MKLVRNCMLAALRRIVGRLPYPAKKAFFGGTISVRKLIFRGRARYCPVCESWLRAFYPFGRPPRPDSWCPVCGSRERQRLLWIFLEGRLDRTGTAKQRVLDVAPDPMISLKLSGLEELIYTTADLTKSHVDVNLDITNIPYSEHSFDMILCSHVLEHVSEDRRAMSEIQRVLAPEGVALIQVPLQGSVTREDPSATTEEARAALFGQRDHVRLYGMDIVQRLEDVGFEVQALRGANLVNNRRLEQMGIPQTELLFVCRKP